VAVLDSTATAVPLPGQDTQPAGARAVGAEVCAGSPDPTIKLVRKGPFLCVESPPVAQPPIPSAMVTGRTAVPGHADPVVRQGHLHGARTHGDAGGGVPSTRAPHCSKAASAVPADTILEDIDARI
jgi:hypothetical protein